MPATTSGPLSSSTSVTTTEAPSSANSSAVACPIPDAPPVTNATLPATCPAMCSLPIFFVARLLGLPDQRRSLLGQRYVEHPQLYPLDALIAIHAERTRDMQRLPTMLGQRIAELLADRAERHAVDDCTIAGLEAQPQMGLADLIGIDELVRRQRQHRLRISAAERTGAIERSCELRRDAARGHRAVDEELVDMARLCNIVRKRFLQIGAKLSELLLAQGDAGGHGMAAALDQDAVDHRLPYHLAEVDAGDRAARTGANAARLERYRKGGARKF